VIQNAQKSRHPDRSAPANSLLTNQLPERNPKKAEALQIAPVSL
jgi:hypothetical protein